MNVPVHGPTRLLIRLFKPLLLPLLLCALPTAATASPKHVILIIGDGFDDQHVTMGRNYLAGMSGTLGVDRLPFRGAVQVETLSTSGRPTYVADSCLLYTSDAADE